MTGLIKSLTDLITECTDEALALIVVGGTMAGYFVGVSVPIELAAGVLAYYFIRHTNE